MDKTKITELDRKLIWHPFTQMKDYKDIPHIIIERGRGIYLYDADGNSYMDTISSWWVNLHGHNNRRITKAVKNQLGKIEHVNFSGFTHEPAVRLAKMITDTLPEKLGKVFYSDNGSTAVEVALKMSFQYWAHKGNVSKSKFIYFDNSYHGDTIGAVSVGGVSLFHSVYKPLLFDSYKAPSPDCLKCTNKEACTVQCISSVEALLAGNKSEICGIIIEPLIQAAGGMIFHKPEFLVSLRNLCDKYGAHLILDEVATGFGRTGEMWAMNHAGITPDFVCISKGISAGYLPLAATVTTDEIYNAFYDDYSTMKTFFHGHSYTANPLACAAGVESLRIFEETGLIEKVKKKSRYLSKKLNAVFGAHRNITNIRVLGMVAAFDIVKSIDSGELFHSEYRIGNMIYREAFRHGLVLRPLGNTVYYYLPLSVTKKEIDTIIKKTADIIECVLGQIAMSDTIGEGSKDGYDWNP